MRIRLCSKHEKNNGIPPEIIIFKVALACSGLFHIILMGQLTGKQVFICTKRPHGNRLFRFYIKLQSEESMPGFIKTDDLHKMQQLEKNYETFV